MKGKPVPQAPTFPTACSNIEDKCKHILRGIVECVLPCI